MGRLLVISLTLFLSVPSLAAQSADCGLFRVVKGKVKFKKKNKTKFKKARINKKVCQGDVVQTEANSRAKIEMADKNELLVSPNSEIVIESYKAASNGKKDGQAVINVVYGKLRSNVNAKYKNTRKSHYRVKTKSAVAGVRGTQFLASFNAANNKSRIVTFEGEVMVSLLDKGAFKGAVAVRPGQFTSNSAGEMPHPAKDLSPGELAQMDRETGGESQPRDVSSQPQPQAEQQDQQSEQPEAEKPQPKAEPQAEPAAEPKAEQPKAEAPAKDASNKPNRPKRGIASAPSADAPGVDAPDVDVDVDVGVEQPDGVDGSRDIASIDAIDAGSMPLPEPTLDNMPEMMDTYQPPRIINNPTDIIGNMPVCQTCDNAVINQNVRVIVRPVFQ